MMRIAAVGLSAAFMAVLTWFVFSTSGTHRLGGLTWEKDLRTAIDRAQTEGKPLLVVFRCPP